MKKKCTDSRDAVLNFLRAELNRRYLYKNVSRFPELSRIDPKLVKAFREFALRRVYPERANRLEIEEAFESLHELLHSPRKMASLGTIAVASMWRLGRRLPQAISAGQQVIHSFSCAKRVESILSEAVLEKHISWKTGLSAKDMERVFAGLPDEPFEELIASLTHLLTLAGSRDTMQAGLDILDRLAETMSASDQWSDNDRHGIALARDTLSEGLELFARIDDLDVERFIRGVEAVEKDWYRSLRTAG